MISCMLKGILFFPTICSLSEVGGFLDAEELHLSLCSISHSGIYTESVRPVDIFTNRLYITAPLSLYTLSITLLFIRLARALS